MSSFTVCICWSTPPRYSYPRCYAVPRFLLVTILNVQYKISNLQHENNACARAAENSDIFPEHWEVFRKIRFKTIVGEKMFKKNKMKYFMFCSTGRISKILLSFSGKPGTILSGFVILQLSNYPTVRTRRVPVE